MADTNEKIDGVVDSIASKTGTDKETIKKAGIIVVAVVAVLLLIKIISGMSDGFMKPINAYAKAISKGDSKKYVKIYSDDLKSYIEDAKGIKDFDDYYDDLIDNTVDSYEDSYGDDVKMSCKLVGKIRYTKDELEELQDSLEDGNKDFDFKLKKAYQIVYKVTIKGDDEKHQYFETTTVVKVDGKWIKLSELYRY